MYSETAHEWVLGRITAVDEQGTVTVSYATHSDGAAEAGTRQRTLGRNDGGFVRRRKATLESEGMLVPVCVLCKELLATVDDLETSATPADRAMAIMAQSGEVSWAGGGTGDGGVQRSNPRNFENVRKCVKTC